MKTLSTILYGLFVALLVGVAALLLVSLLPITGNVEIKIVKSGSMEPTIHTGSLVVVFPTGNYHAGDVVTFGKDTKTSIPTTHRIVSERTEGGKTYYTTQGDANEDPDPEQATATSVIGKVLFSVPFAGYVLDFARQPLGFALLIGAPAAMIVIDEAITIVQEIALLRRRKLKKRAALAQRTTPALPHKPQVLRERLPTI